MCNSDTQNIEHLINFKNFEHSACIKKYYKTSTNKYYQKNDNNFIYPDILHGCSHPNRTFYGIIVEKCRNDSQRYLSDDHPCKSTEDIKSYISKSSIQYDLIKKR